MNILSAKFRAAPQKYVETQPSLCKYFQENGCCKFGEGCAYAHIETVIKNDVNKLSEEIKNIKAQMDILKNTVSALSDKRMEDKVIMDTVYCLQKYICNLKVKDLNIAEKIRLLKQEFYDSDSEESPDEECVESNKI